MAVRVLLVLAAAAVVAVKIQQQVEVLLDQVVQVE
jgi:hypothetical protein